MDSRSFIIGITCGAIVGVTAGWLLAGDSGEVITTSAEHEANSAIVPDVVTVAPIATDNTQEPPTVADLETSDPQSSSETSTDPIAPWPANLRAELESEPKDDSWAYYMEQTLLQFLGSHPSMAQFDISNIECRTTKCLIEVTGYEESTVPVWQQVMYDIRQQPWSEFGQHGTSSGNIDGRVTIVGMLQRVTEQE